MLPDDLFDHLEPSSERTHLHIMHGVSIPRDNPKPVALRLKFCGRGSPLWNAMMKLKPLTDRIEASKRMAALFARHGVIDWENVVLDGKPMPYSTGACTDLFEKLIDRNRVEFVDGALSVAQDPDNFTPPLVEAGELGKK